jgi:diguanylate cyclase (GGDEF)-like protein
VVPTTVQALADHHVYFGLLRRDGSYQELFTGPNRERLLGGSPAVGQDPSALWRSRIHPADLDAFRACDTRLRAGVPSRVDYRVHGLDGVTRWIRVQLQPQEETADGVYVAGILADVTEQRRVEAELRAALAGLARANAELDAARLQAMRLAGTDPLTGAANRRHADGVLRQLLAGGRHNVGVLITDVDDFKRVNDEHGHRAGDEVLVEVVARLEHAVRAEDTVARWGGEEFLVISSTALTFDDLRALGERMRTAVSARPVATSAGDVAVTLSVGAVTNCCTTPYTVDALLDAADEALLTAKRSGKNRVELARNGRAARLRLIS